MHPQMQGLINIAVGGHGFGHFGGAMQLPVEMGRCFPIFKRLDSLRLSCLPGSSLDNTIYPASMPPLEVCSYSCRMDGSPLAAPSPLYQRNSQLLTVECVMCGRTANLIPGFVFLFLFAERSDSL